MDVAVADPAGFDFDEHLVTFGDRFWDGSVGQGVVFDFVYFGAQLGFHQVSLYGLVRVVVFVNCCWVISM